MVITSLDCIVDPISGRVAPTVQHTVHTLTDHDIPLVLMSARSPRELRRVQRELGIVAPFLSGGGSILHVPVGYFPGPTSAEEGEWEIVEFNERGAPPDNGVYAVRTLLAKYRQHRPDMVAIGLGSDWSDRFLLQSVDVPVVVRRTGIDHKALEQACPNAFVTPADGPSGWSEALLGQT